MLHLPAYKIITVIGYYYNDFMHSIILFYFWHLKVSMMNSSNLMINLVLSISFDANVDPCVVMEGVIDPELHIN